MLNAHVERRCILSLIRDGQQITYESGPKLNVGSLPLGEPPKQELIPFDETTFVASREGTPIELKANDEFTLELNQALKD
jgi:hypothetical protein